ncbi:MAG: glycosyltransferase [Defluviitaleaceae bacterium]|nr:glycosyltransferase [Defluviitaleaceae bacterium]
MKSNCISVIVPIYNLEDYAPKCVESILCQTYENLEVILVNDGSTDQSGALCDHYKKDKRVKVIHKKNGGLSDARNVGMDAATGEYIGFVDGDDFICPDFYETLVALLKESDADVSMLTFNKVKNGVAAPKLPPEDMPQVYERDDALKLLLMDKEIESYVWNKLYKAELLKGLRFPLGMVFEDVCIMFQVFLRMNRLVYLKQPKYNYVFRQSSILNSNEIKTNVDSITVVTQIYHEAAKMPHLDKYRCYNFVLWYLRSHYYSIKAGATDLSHLTERHHIFKEAFERHPDFILKEQHPIRKVTLFAMMHDLNLATLVAKAVEEYVASVDS